MAEQNADDVVDRIAERFHRNYEMLAPAYGWETRRDTAVAWEDVPGRNKILMRHTVRALLKSGHIMAGPAALTDGDGGGTDG